MALGTIKTDADILLIANTGVISALDVSSLFVDYALPELIDRGCFNWNTGDNNYISNTVKFNSEYEYSSELSKTTSIDVSSNVGYGGVTASAGYKKSSTDTSKATGTYKIARGMSSKKELVGALTNKCFRDPKLFQTVKDLVRPEWINRWKKIRAATSLEAMYSLGDDYTKVVSGGFYMPVQYNYGVWVHNEFTSSYSATSSAESHDASHAISTGLSVDLAGVKAGVQSTITKATKKSDSQNQSDRTVFVSTKKGGSPDINVNCQQGRPVYEDCNTMFDQSINEIREDLNKLSTHPTSIDDFIPLDSLVKAYFNDNVGLGDIFNEAIVGAPTPVPTPVPCLCLKGFDDPPTEGRKICDDCPAYCHGVPVPVWHDGIYCDENSSITLDGKRNCWGKCAFHGGGCPKNYRSLHGICDYNCPWRKGVTHLCVEK